MTDSGRLPDSYFDQLYRENADPWRLAEGFYERRKRAVIMASLPRPRFTACFEPGCALGLNTLELARRCDRVLATDVSPAALDATRDRTRSLGNVTVERAAVPDEWPADRFDLVVFSEIGYYVRDLPKLARGLKDVLSDDGVLVACHWRHPAPDYPSTAAEVHDAVGAELNHLAGYADEDFLLDVWTRDGTSIARHSGLLD